ncbi:hypothetical protein Ae331Ps2_6381 [Pseudonocardia sp. Ae331_Ps2]|nr:hypothetical protein Ae331Ps2_6381 [Pseudonocardia sp. Ae331_Ps2]
MAVVVGGELEVVAADDHAGEALDLGGGELVGQRDREQPESVAEGVERGREPGDVVACSDVDLHGEDMTVVAPAGWVEDHLGDRAGQNTAA